MTLAFKFSATEGTDVVLVRPKSRRIGGDLLHLLAKVISSWIDSARHYAPFGSSCGLSNLELTIP